MKTKLAVLLSLMTAFTLSAFAVQTTVTGVLTDSMCTKKHMMSGASNADCVRECIKDGSKYVVVSEGKVIELAGKNEQLKDLAGKKVKITGDLKGKTLSVQSAEVAQ